MKGSLSIFFLAVLAFCAPVARAQLIFDVAVNTAPLVGHAAGPFSLFFTLTDGDAESNTITFSDFDFGTGSAMGTPFLTGGASGDLSASVTLTDSSFVNDFVQEFDPGALLKFRVTMTTNYSGSGSPDGFSWGVLDTSGMPLPMLSYGAYGADAFMIVSIDGAAPVLNVFGSDSSLPPFGGGDEVEIAEPRVELVEIPNNPVPEPSTYGLMAAALLGAVAWVRRRRAVAQRS